MNLPPESDPDELWAAPGERRGLIPLAAAKWAQAQQDGVFERVLASLIEARHVEKKAIGQPGVAAEALSAAGIEGDSVVEEILSDRRWLDAARSDHEEGAAIGVFGVPSLVFPEARPVYLKLLGIPEDDRAAEVFRKVEAISLDPLFQEVKRPAPLGPQ